MCGALHAENARDFSAKTARMSVNFCKIFERNARAWLAKSAQRHLSCSDGHKEHQCIDCMLVPHFWCAFCAELCGNFAKFSAQTRDFAPTLMQNRRATHAQRLQNMRAAIERMLPTACIDQSASCDRTVRCTAKNARNFRRKPRDFR